MIDRYKIISKLGQGGLGAVYKAYDNQLKRYIAIKRLLPDPDKEGEDTEEALLEEASTLSSLQHPNIVTLYDFGQDEEGSFFVMEYLNGETLEEVVEGGALSYEDFELIVNQSLGGLSIAHDVGLIHRDLKPGNLMLTWLPDQSFQVKILDFGMAKFSPKPQIQTMDHGGSVFGSIYFMAPEQFDRRPVTKKTDIYSIGCIFYYCLAGKYPFDGETVSEIMASHINHKVTPLHQIRTDVDRWVCDWVMKLLEKEDENRPISAKEALDYFLNQKVPPSKKLLSQPIQLNLNRMTGKVQIPAKKKPEKESKKVEVVEETENPEELKNSRPVPVKPVSSEKIFQLIGLGVVFIFICYGIYKFVDEILLDNSAKQEVTSKKKVRRSKSKKMVISSELPIYDPIAEMDKVVEEVGNIVKLKGYVEGHRLSGSGARVYLQFDPTRTDLIEVSIPSSKRKGVFTEEIIASYFDKDIVAKGKVKDYFGTWKLEVKEPSDIKIKD